MSLSLSLGFIVSSTQPGLQCGNLSEKDKRRKVKRIEKEGARQGRGGGGRKEGRKEGWEGRRSS